MYNHRKKVLFVSSLTPAEETGTMFLVTAYRKMAYSHDGLNWQSQDLTWVPSGKTYSHTFDGTTYSLVTASNNGLSKSTDLISWTTTTQSGVNSFLGTGAQNSVCAIYPGTQAKGLRTVDGNTYSGITLPVTFTNALRATNCNDRLVLPYAAGTIYYTDDGVTFGSVTTGLATNVASTVLYKSGRYVHTNHVIAAPRPSVSTDFTTWTQSEWGNGNTFVSANGIIADNKFVYVGNNSLTAGANALSAAYSSDGLTWTINPISTSHTTSSSQLAYIAYGNGMYVVSCAGNGSPLFVSSDLANWQQVSLGWTVAPTGVHFV